MTALDLDEVRGFLREYYGKRITSSSDLQLSACCSDETQKRFFEILRLIPEEVKRRQYGCGSPLPADDLTGLHAVDLGAGAGTDAFIAAKLVGPAGRVTGIDMTAEQLETARRNIPRVMEAFGIAEPNVRMLEGYIETADAIPDASADLVISNCVINLSPRKDLVFQTIHRMLRPGGEFYIADIVCDRRLPLELRRRRDLYSECLTGAEYRADLFDIMEAAGFRDVRTVSSMDVPDRVGLEAATFSSVTLRGFKLPLDRRCEDYGQIATYLGTCPNLPVDFRLDAGHLFETGRPMPVCRNTASMLTQTRLGKYFSVTPALKHFGLFDCGPRNGEQDAACCS